MKVVIGSSSEWIGAVEDLGDEKRCWTFSKS